MLMQEKLYDYSSDYRPPSVGDYSPVIVAAAVNLCRNTASPRLNHLNSYECSKYMPLCYSSKIFSEYSQLLAKPSILSSASISSVPYLTMQLPIRTSTLTRHSSDENDTVSTSDSNTITENHLAFATLPVKRTLDGCVKTNETVSCQNQRTQSVIMKIEDQHIVEVPTNELITRNTNEMDDEVICKWINCYR